MSVKNKKIRKDCLLAAIVFVLLSPSNLKAFEMQSGKLGNGAPLVVNGFKVQSPIDWPATMTFMTAVGISLGGCTSTIVGDQVVLTAAHCVSDGEEGVFKIGGVSRQLICSQHPEYADGTNKTADFALCYSASRIADVQYERVNTSIAMPRLGSPVQLLGYGCNDVGGFDASYGVLFLGSASVTRLPVGKDLEIIAEGSQALCFGDSGGGGFMTTNYNGSKRTIIGVNSRSDISEKSYLSSVSSEIFVDWAIEWAKSNGSTICGIHSKAIGCRP